MKVSSLLLRKANCDQTALPTLLISSSHWLEFVQNFAWQCSCSAIGYLYRKLPQVSGAPERLGTESITLMLSKGGDSVAFQTGIWTTNLSIQSWTWPSHHTPQTQWNPLFKTILKIKKILPFFKGHPKQWCKLAWKWTKCAHIFTCRICLVVLPLLYKRSTFFFPIWALPGVDMLLCSLPMKSWKKVGSWRTCYSVVHAGLAHDVFDTDCWPQNGSTHGHVSVTFKLRFLTKKSETELTASVPKKDPKHTRD